MCLLRVGDRTLAGQAQMQFSGKTFETKYPIRAYHIRSLLYNKKRTTHTTLPRITERTGYQPQLKCVPLFNTIESEQRPVATPLTSLARESMHALIVLVTHVV